MVTRYVNEKTKKLISEWEYDMLPPEEQEEYLYLGMRPDYARAEDISLPDPPSERVKVGQTVTGTFDTAFGWNWRVRMHLKGTVIGMDRNRFFVHYPNLKIPKWKYYYKDIGRIVFPHRGGDEDEQI